MRKANLGVAIFLFLIGTIVMYDAVRLGFRWVPGFGPGAGYLPFYLALGVLICTGISIVKQIRQLSKDGVGDKPLIQKGGLTPILWVLVPSTVMVILTSIIGLHLAAAVFIFFYMFKVGGDIGWLKCALVSILFPIGMYIVFDRFFLIPLPYGMLGEYLKLPF